MELLLGKPQISSNKPAIKLNHQTKEKGIIVLNVSLEEKGITQTTDPDSKSLFDNLMLQKKYPIKSNLHLKKPIYKINLFHQNNALVVDFLKDFEQIHAYYWKNGVVSLRAKQFNKTYGIQAIMKDHKDCQLICMGDGYNNFEMLQFADIGIVMANTHYETLHKIANLTSPQIDKNA